MAKQHFKIYGHCPVTTIKVNFDHSGVPLEVLLHMVACDNCRRIINEYRQLRKTSRHDKEAEEREMSLWDNTPGSHPNASEINRLIKLKLSKSGSKKLALHLEKCHSCREVAEIKRRKPKTQH